jgi:hypothetical protein
MLETTMFICMTQNLCYKTVTSWDNTDIDPWPENQFSLWIAENCGKV